MIDAPCATVMDDAVGDMTDRELLIRVDERTRSIESRVQHLEKRLSGGYVSRQEFSPVQKIVYGLVAVVLLAVVGAVIALVVKGAA